MRIALLTVLPFRQLLREPKSLPFLSLRRGQYVKARARDYRRRTIRCAIRDAEETHYRNDVHLLPMAAHFRLLDGVDNTDSRVGADRDIAVSVFDMEGIRDVLFYLGNDRESSRSAIHARDRSKVKYATSPVLAKLSSADCSEEMIQQICSLYHVDVQLMKWLGFGGEAVEKCK